MGSVLTIALVLATCIQIVSGLGCPEETWTDGVESHPCSKLCPLSMSIFQEINCKKECKSTYACVEAQRRTTQSTKPSSTSIPTTRTLRTSHKPIVERSLDPGESNNVIWGILAVIVVGVMCVIVVIVVYMRQRQRNSVCGRLNGLNSEDVELSQCIEDTSGSQRSSLAPTGQLLHPPVQETGV